MIATAILAACPATIMAADTSQLTAMVQQAVERGERLYLHDRAAWQATDDLREHFPDLLPMVGGYITTDRERTTGLVFYDRSKIRALYRASFSNGTLASSGRPTAATSDLSPLERELISAKDKAVAAFAEAKAGLCAKASPNITALSPDEPGGPIIVYMMTPQTNLETFPLGGHYSVEVRSDGSTGKVRKFTNSCLDMPVSGRPKDARAAAFVVTHLLDPVPTEIHVFTSLASKVPIVVLTSPQGRMWTVDGNTVRSAKLPAK
jgi:hypothetical protein